MAKYVRVQGSKILSPEGNELFLTIGTWENPVEGTVSQSTVINFMDTMKSLKINCLLLKANMWLVNDDLSKNQANVNKLHGLIQNAEQRGIYTIINLFDVWSRGKGGNSFNTNPATHPINVWNWGHRHKAATYIKWVTKEFIRYPRVLFELGNEMERNGASTFSLIAKRHLLPHFYYIAGRDRPIGVSQQPLWSLPVNVIFNHAPNNMPTVGVNDRPIITNELAYDTDLWKDSVIRNASRSQEYYNAFARAKQRGHSGVAAATIININNGLNAPARNVLTKLGTYSKGDTAVPPQPPVSDKPTYWICPSHMSVGQGLNEMLANMGNGWPELFKKIDGIKYYWQQGKGDSIPRVDPRRLANFSRAKWISCEFGAFSKKSNHDPYDWIWNALDPMINYGANIRSLHLDNAFGKRMFGWGDSLDEAKVYLADFCKHVSNRFPKMHYGMTTSIPNWHWSPALKPHPGHFTSGHAQSTGVYLRDVIKGFSGALKSRGLRLGAFDIDCPYDYYINDRETYRRIYHELYKWCKANNVKLHLICNARANMPGDGVKFKRDSLLYYDVVISDSKRSDYPFKFDLITCQSWYKYPARVYPETQDNTFTNTALKMINRINGQPVTTTQPPVTTTQPPPPSGEIKRFRPIGTEVRLFEGCDNGNTALTSTGELYMTVGDAPHEWFPDNPWLRESPFYKLKVHGDPMRRSHWELFRGKRGKCYGMTALGDTVLALVSDKGSLYEGSQNVRVMNIKTGWKSNGTLQDRLFKDGVNWFFIEKGYDCPVDEVLIACAELRGDDFLHDIKGPLRVWRGNPFVLQSMQYLGKIHGIDNSKVQMSSIRKVGNRWVAGIGSLDTHWVYQYVTSGASAMVGYNEVWRTQFKPPMHCIPRPHLNLTSGPFTLNYFKFKNQWYMLISGYGPKGPNGLGDDATYIQKVEPVY